MIIQEITLMCESYCVKESQHISEFALLAFAFAKCGAFNKCINFFNLQFHDFVSHDRLCSIISMHWTHCKYYEMDLQSLLESVRIKLSRSVCNNPDLKFSPKCLVK